MTYSYELRIPELSKNVPLLDFHIEKGVFGKGSKAKLIVKKDDAVGLEVGYLIKVYLFNHYVFSGYVRYINEKAAVSEIDVAGEENILYRRYERKKVYPEDVGQSVDMDVADIVRYIIDNYTDYSHDVSGVDTIKDTGVRMTKFVINEYLANALDRISKVVGYVWYVRDGVFYFEKPQYVGSGVELNNKNAVFDKWKIRTDRLVNELHLIGAPLEYQRSDYFRGDGATKEFKLSYIPSGNIRVFVEGEEIGRDEYEINYDVPSIVFDNPPPYYNPSGDALANAYSGWTWKRKVTVNVDSGASPSSITDPTILLELDDNDVDWVNIKGDYSDIRFAWTDGTNVTELPYVYLGSSGTTRYFAVKLSGFTLNAGDTFEFYMLYGNSEADAPIWTRNDVMEVYDEFNYSGSLDSTKWHIGSIEKVCDESTCGDLTNCYYNDPGNHSSSVWPSQSYAIVSSWVTFKGVLYRWNVVNVSTNDINYPVKWVFYFNKNKPYFYETGVGAINHAETYVIAEWSYACGVDKSPKKKYLYDGVWYFRIFNPDVTISIGDRELNASYNVEVRYAFKAPIYVKYEDIESQNKYGTYSKVIRANWIVDWDMAKLMASKYISQYSEPLYENNVRIPLKKYLDFGLRAGMKVNVNDSLHGVDGLYVIYSEKWTPRSVTITLGTETFDIFEWGAKVEERIRQLETEGDENFFTL